MDRSEVIGQVLCNVSAFLTAKERANLAISNPARLRDVHAGTTKRWFPRAEIEDITIARRQMPRLERADFRIMTEFEDAFLEVVAREFADLRTVHITVGSTAVDCLDRWMAGGRIPPRHWQLDLLISSEERIDTAKRILASGRVHTLQTYGGLLPKFGDAIVRCLIVYPHRYLDLAADHAVRCEGATYVVDDVIPYTLPDPDRAEPHLDVLIDRSTPTTNKRSAYVEALPRFPRLWLVRISHWSATRLVIVDPTLLRDIFTKIPGDADRGALVLIEGEALEDPGVLALIEVAIAIQDPKKLLPCGCVARRIGVHNSGVGRRSLCARVIAKLARSPAVILVPEGYVEREHACPCRVCPDAPDLASVQDLVGELVRLHGAVGSMWSHVAWSGGTNH